MIKRLLTFLVAGLMLLTFVPVVVAGTQGSSCGSDVVYAYLYENSIGDTSDNNDVLIRCTDVVANMGNIDHTLPGDCNAPPFGKVNWNDCVSSVSVVQPANYVFCAYKDTNYHTLIKTIWGSSGRVNIPTDQMSSFKQVRLGACPTS